MGLKDRMKPLTLVEKTRIGYPGLAVFKFRPSDGSHILPFEAGQYMTIGDDVAKPDGVKFVPRPYSVASSPLDKNFIEFYIVQVDGGEFTPHLFTKKIGEQVWYMGPKGKFTLSRSTLSNLVFICTGTGLAPFISFLRTLKGEGKSKNHVITLMFGNRTSLELGYLDELRGYEVDPDFDFIFVPTVSRPQEESKHDPRVGIGRVNDLFRSVIGLPKDGKVDPKLPAHQAADAIRARMPAGGTAYFMCGNPDMIKDVKAAVTEKSLAPDTQIFTEDYW